MVTHAHFFLQKKKKKSNPLHHKPPRFSWLALNVVRRPRPFGEPLFELVVTDSGTLRRKLVSEVFLKSFELSLSIRVEGAGGTSSEELALASTHSWNCDKEDRRWFQS